MRGTSMTMIAAVIVAAFMGHAEEAKPKLQASPAVAVISGVPITAAELEEKVSARLTSLRAQEYLFKQQALDEMIAAVLLEKEAASRGVSVSELTRTEIEGKAVPVTEEEKKQEYERARPRFGKKSEAEAMKVIDASLRQRRVQESSRKFIAELKAKAGARVLLEPPRVKVDTVGAPARGSNSAPVTIVEFCDFQCPYCARVLPTLKRLLLHYGDNLQVVHRDYPLPFHAHAPKAAEAARCSAEQGKFWEMHDWLFENQTELDVPNILSGAAELGLDAKAFAACLDTDAHAGDWSTDVDLAKACGVTGTPALFINGRFVNGARPYEELAQVIDDELARVGIRTPGEQKTAAAAGR